MTYSMTAGGVSVLRETGGPPLDQLHARAALALMYTVGVSPADAAVLDMSPADIVEDLRHGSREVSRTLGRRVGATSWDCVEAQLERMAKLQVRVLSRWDAGYPDYLRLIDSPPPVLFYMGRPAPLAARGVAVVGSRKPSPAGVRLARGLARDLSLAGVPVVSGLARGIDTAAHEGALQGPAPGVAVLGTGLDVPYPSGNAGLMLEIAAHGCVVSEQPLGTPPQPHVFPRRNRLISAFSHAVVVVEAGERSGALITARWALEQGRDVGAVPGFPGDFRSAGTNRLLKQGAFVVERAADVLAALPALARAPVQSLVGGSTADGDESAESCSADTTVTAVFSAVTGTPADADAIAAHTGLAVEDVQQALFELEMAGRVDRDPMGRYTRVD